MEKVKNILCLKKIKKDEVIMMPIHRKQWIENVAKLVDKTVTSPRVALSFTLSSAAFLPDIVGKKKLQQEDLVASTSSLHRCKKKNFKKQNQKISKIV